MSAKPNFAMDDELTALLQGFDDVAMREEMWPTVAAWAADLYGRTGSPASVADFYRDLSTLDLSEDQQDAGEAALSAFG